MAEIISCPSCQRKLQVPDTLIGQDVQCPTCGATFLAKIAGGPTAPPPLAEAPPPLEEPLPLERSSRKEWDDDDDNDRSKVRKRRRRDLEPHRASLILVLGIVSFFFMPIILGPIAWILGNSDLAAMRAGRMDPDGESQTNAGRICGMISTIGYVAILVLVFCVCGLVMVTGQRQR